MQRTAEQTRVHGSDRGSGRSTDVLVDLRSLRIPGGLMILLAFVLPRMPGHPGLACPLRTLTGIPCPACGMTTSVEATVGFDLAEAWRANPMGIVAVATALVAVVAWFPVRVKIPWPAVILVLAAMWVFQLFRFGIV